MPKSCFSASLKACGLFEKSNTTEGGDWMKKLVSLLMMAALAVSLSACATGGKDKVRTKCPACGYEFEAPIEN